MSPAELLEIGLLVYVVSALFFAFAFRSDVRGSGWIQFAWSVAMWPLVVVLIVLVLWWEFH